MRSELYTRDGRRWLAERQPTSGWYVVRGARPKLGEPLTMDGIRREVVVVAQLSSGAFGLHLLPDFEDPGCEACARAPMPPTPEQCRALCGPRRPH